MLIFWQNISTKPALKFASTQEVSVLTTALGNRKFYIALQYTDTCLVHNRFVDNLLSSFGISQCTERLGVVTVCRAYSCINTMWHLHLLKYSEFTQNLNRHSTLTSQCNVCCLRPCMKPWSSLARRLRWHHISAVRPRGYNVYMDRHHNIRPSSAGLSLSYQDVNISGLSIVVS